MQNIATWTNSYWRKVEVVPPHQVRLSEFLFIQQRKGNCVQTSYVRL